MISWEDFQKVDMRVGTIVSAEPFPEARKPAYKLQIDFGELGLKKSSAQITTRHELATLTGTQVIAVVNFPPKQIGPFISECLVMGIYAENNEVVLIQPNQNCPNGSKIG
ncbi:MAG: tRNA-binding protein [Marinoscillum sp.]